MLTKPAIHVTNLHFRYQDNGQELLNIPDWQVEQGQSLFISGPSGSGKSTLLNLICGALVPTSGNIDILGGAFSQLRGTQRDAKRAKHIGVVFQQFNLIPYLSVRQNIQAAAYFAGAVKQNLDVRLLDFFTQLQLEPALLDRQASLLSVGQQQRVAIVRALINSPEILVVDEPTSALDANARDAFMEMLLKLTQTNKSTLLFVSHDSALAGYFEQHISMAELSTLGAESL
ncbi:ABC transporter ATP-binding protein [Glaciecola siphonariae]|uniref:ABC transporter ATP-binding protein n=1 Tax=Glaciecola siphonariae TaxID=521012 RepID=A0ABV9M0Z1_9ALTE